MTVKYHFWNLQHCSQYFGTCRYLSKYFFSQQVQRNLIIANKNVKYESTDELPKISELHESIV